MGCGFWAGLGVCSFAYLQSNLPTFFSRESIVGRHWAAIPSRLIGLGQFHLFFFLFSLWRGYLGIVSSFALIWMLLLNRRA